MDKPSVVILTPVLDDWPSFRLLLKDVDDALEGQDLRVAVVAVDDGSSTDPDLAGLAPASLRHIASVEVLHLSCNLGHQRALAIGLAHTAVERDVDAVLVMDSDGEDWPGDLPALLGAWRADPGRIVVARRAKRSEGRAFRIGYAAYKLVFRLFAGRAIGFGNFCLIPRRCLDRLVYMADLWNHLAATISRSRFPITELPTSRGERYVGEPRMRLMDLVVFGMSAVAVYSDVAMVRIVLAATFLGVLTALGLAVVTVIRFATDLAIPGWASGVAGSLAVILVQSVVVALFALFLQLKGRSQREFIPAKHYPDYLRRVETL